MKVQTKLFLILVSFSLLLVIILASLMQWSIGKGMVEYVNTKQSEAIRPLIAEIATEYKINNDWSTLKGEERKFADLVYLKLKDSGFLEPQIGFPGPPTELANHEANIQIGPPSAGSLPPANMPPPGSMPPEFDRTAPSDIQGEDESSLFYVVLDKTKKVIVGFNYDESQYNTTEIIIVNDVVGYLAVPKRKEILDGYELEFIEQQKDYLWLFVLFTMFLVVVFTLPLAKHMLTPVKIITKGMHQLTQGQYKSLIGSDRKDELGELIRDFNELVFTLDENENARKRWLANISHELRTPVAILRGELEAMLDNVRPINKESIESTNDEVKHLQYLIDDLHQLTSADIGGMHYKKKVENINEWILSEGNKYTGYLSDAGIQLEIKLSKKEATVFADTSRLCQLFENLINNCIKYSQANVVKISSEIESSATKPMLILKLEDDGLGVEEKHFANLFEPLYRVEDSRNRKTGGTGLGLSICAHIVAAHQGKISAEQSSLGGLAIVIELPLSI